MVNAAIQVENLSKRYRLGVINHHTLTHDLQSWWARLRGKEDPNSLVYCTCGKDEESFWALKDVTFEVKQGEVLGIIGRNGAGKSTLLKILSQVTAPTSGEVRLKGRIASLLEVGTGFHPDLTGRENIFLNGAILGMSKADIRKRLDGIIDFAEVERFIDTPVKRYSSGMYVRLAFAVAAHLEPEILVVDEVLAVGDAQFQKKCLGKMEKVGREGRTILFVSHNMAAIQSLCSRAVLLAAGKMLADGAPQEVVRTYLDGMDVSASVPLSERKDRTGNGRLLVRQMDLQKRGAYAIGDDIVVHLVVENTYPDTVVARAAMSIRDQNDVGLIVCDSIMTGEHCRLPGASVSKLTCRIYAPPLNYGEYLLNVAIFINNQAEDWILSAGRFSIEAGAFHDQVVTLPFPVLTRFQWRVEDNE